MKKLFLLLAFVLGLTLMAEAQSIKMKNNTANTIYVAGVSKNKKNPLGSGMLNSSYFTFGNIAILPGETKIIHKWNCENTFYWYAKSSTGIEYTGTQAFLVNPVLGSTFNLDYSSDIATSIANPSYVWKNFKSVTIPSNFGNPGVDVLINVP